MPNELKPCPFCGSLQIDIFSFDPYDGYQGDNASWIVRCKDCKAQVYDRNKEKAKEKWNTRVLSNFEKKWWERGV